MRQLDSATRQQAWRLSWAYFGYFAVLALIVPYLGVYLDALGFQSRQIGELIAIATACRIVGPPLWASVTDRTGRRLPAIRIGVVAALIFLLLLTQVDSYLQVALLLGSLSLFWSAILPQLEVVTLTSLGGHSNLYSRIRAGGSVGFIIIALLAAELLAWGGRDSLPLLGAILLLPLLLCVWLVREPAAPPRTQTRLMGLGKLLTRRPFVLFILSTVLIQLSFAPFYAFFALYLGQLGYPPLAVGALIALGVVAEIGLFMIASKLVVRFPVSHLLAFCLAVTAVRWALLAEFATVLAWLIFVQLLHAISFALHHSTAMRFIHRYFPPEQHGRGQAIYVGIGFGGGGALGAWLAGLTWQQGEGATLTFLGAAVAAALGAVLALAMGRREIADDQLSSAGGQ